MVKKAFILLLLCLCSGCASFSSKRWPVVQAVSEGRYDEALGRLEKLERGNLMDLMDRGTIYYYQRRFKEADQFFDQAENRIDDLFARSVSRDVATFLVNDLTQAYSGEHFERVWVNIMRAFGFIGLGNLESALVEIRKIDRKLQVYADEFSGSIKFRNPAFAHYLSGLLHEAGGEINDAHVSYRKALKAYQQNAAWYGVAVPNSLKRDILFTSARLGFFDELKKYQTAFMPEVKNPRLSQQHEMVVIVLSGRIAHKEERYWAIDSAMGPILKVAYPEFVETPFQIKKVIVHTAAGDVSSSLVEDVSALAEATLSDRLDLIYARASARALARAGAAAAAGVAVAKKTEDEALGALTAWFANALLSQTERADTRSWLTLPGRVLMARFSMPQEAQQVDFELEYTDQSGHKVYSERITKSLGGNRMHFVFVHAIEPQ